MNLTRNQVIVVGAGAVILILAALILFGIIPGLKTSNQSGGQNVNLSVWGVEDESGFQVFIDNYKKIRPNAKIAYTKIPEADYENILVSALAAGRGPDIFMFHSSWLLKHSDKIVEAPSNQFSITQLRELFPKIAEQDFASGDKIYALPLYIDTLALLYNKDVFDAKAVALPPTTWQDFQNLIPKIRELNSAGQIVKAAAAIGGSEQSVSKSADLLNNVLMQFGNPVSDNSGGFDFDAQGLSAFNFYLQFANPASAYYTWNDNLGSSLDLFSRGQTAMIFNYSGAITTLQNKNPFLNIGIAPFPQFSGASQPVNNADYFGLAVSRQSRNPIWAWDFIVNSAADSKTADAYFEAGGRPPALRTLIAKYLGDPRVGVFAKQALTARSWPKPEMMALRQIFSNAVESALAGRLSASQALDQVKSQINSNR